MPDPDPRLIEILEVLPRRLGDYVLDLADRKRWQDREARRVARDAAIVDLATRHYPDRPSARSKSRAMADDLSSLAYQPQGAVAPRDLDVKTEALRRVIDLCGSSKIPQARHLARILVAAKDGADKSRATAAAKRQPSGLTAHHK